MFIFRRYGFLSPRATDFKRVHTFVGKKERRPGPNDPGEYGDTDTYVATDREAKFIVAHEIGKRDERTTDIFIRDLSERVEC